MVSREDIIFSAKLFLIAGAVIFVLWLLNRTV